MLNGSNCDSMKSHFIVFVTLSALTTHLMPVTSVFRLPQHLSLVVDLKVTCGASGAGAMELRLEAQLWLACPLFSVTFVRLCRYLMHTAHAVSLVNSCRNAPEKGEEDGDC